MKRFYILSNFIKKSTKSFLHRIRTDRYKLWLYTIKLELLTYIPKPDAQLKNLIIFLQITTQTSRYFRICTELIIIKKSLFLAQGTMMYNEMLPSIESDMPKKVPYPKRIFLILGTEFCERFMYYGMASK